MVRRAGKVRAVAISAEAAETHRIAKVVLVSGFMLSTLLALLLISP